MKSIILLVYPKIEFEENYPCSWIPYSVLAIASALPQDKFETIIFDENRKSAQDFESLLKSIPNPMCVGFSIMTGGGQIGNALSLAEIAKSVCPKVINVFGGPHVNVLPLETLQHPLIDYVLVGPGQTSFPMFVRALCGEENFTDVPGLLGVQDGNLIRGKVNILTQSTLVPYNFDFINVRDYIQSDATISSRTVNYISTQGCVYKCRFCYETHYKRRYGKLPCDVVMNDIEAFADKFHVNGIKFYDADWFIDTNRALKLIDALATIRIHWAASIHPKDVLRSLSKHQLLLEKLARSGCRRLLMGVESGSNRVLNEVVNKGVTKEEIFLVAEEISKHGILGSYTFIVGFPGETLEEQEETFDFVRKLWTLPIRPETRIHIYTPYPGTQLYDEAISMGFQPPRDLSGWSNFDYYKATTPWTDKMLEKRVQDFTSMIPK